MARVIGSPIGELRGKLAGMVFSKNASGAIVRQYVIPTNANSGAQIAARTTFRSSVMRWKSLSQIEQQGWGVFAVNTFVPLRKINVGQFTGQQAANAIMTSALTCITRDRDPTFVAIPPVIPPDPEPTCVKENFLIPTIAPLFSVIPTIAQLGIPPASMSFSDFVVSNVGLMKFTITFEGIPIGGLNAGEFIDPNGVRFSFSAYISDPVSQAGNRPKNQFFMRLANANLCTFPVDDLNGLEGVELSWNFVGFMGGFKSFPVPGKICKITIVVVGEDGTQAVAGSDYVTIT